jgi:Flp pilus assembly protein TadG
MRLRIGLLSLLSRLGKDENATVLVQFTVYLVAILGMIGLALNGGQFILVHNSLQDLADAAALAGAWQLDGTTGARTRATNAAQAMANNNPPRWYDASVGSGGSTSIGTPLFYSAISLSGDTPATGDKDAKYIKVTTAASGTLPTFLVAVGAGSNTATATAMAESTSSQCFPSSMMLCNPSEPLTGSTGDTSSFNPTAGQMFVFSTTGNTGGYSPGVFNLLDDPSGSGSDAAIEKFLSQQYGSVCFTQGTSPAQGQKTSATDNGINVRFDEQPNGNVNGVDLTPAPIVIDGISTTKQGNSCHVTSALPTTPPFDPTQYSTTCNSTGSCPLPRDPPASFISVGGSGGSQIGGGVASSDLQTYWANHHPGTLPAGVTTRWQLYQLEVAGTGNAGTWLTDALEPHAPQCLSTGGPEFIAQRRILHVAVVDCLYWGVTGNKVNNIPINTYADFFLTESTPTSGPTNGNIYTEYVSKQQINAPGSLLHRIVQLVR